MQFRSIISSVPFCSFVAVTSLAFGEVETPTLLPDASSSAANLNVMVSCSTSGSTIHYTLNGAEPTIYDPVVASGSAITIRRNATLKAKAWLWDEESFTASATFDITGEVSAGGQHALALKSSGAVYAWADQYYYQLGNNVTSYADQASPVPSNRSSGNPILDAVAVSAGSFGSVVLDSAGNPWCYGHGFYGQMGNNSTANQGYAVRVIKSTTANDWLTDCVGVGAGRFFTGALTSSGNVYTWGIQTNGQLGNGVTTGTRNYAGKVKTSASGNPDLQGIKAIELGDSHVLARDSSGNVWSWGSNSYGQLGIGSLVGQSYAGKVMLNSTTELTDAWDISSGDLHSAVVRWKADDPNLQGSVWTFGDRSYGKVGDNGVPFLYNTYPVQVKKIDGTFLSGIIQVSASSSHTLGLDEDGHVWAWGYNGYGAIGDGTTTHRSGAVKVKNPSGTGDLANIVSISAGGDTTANFSLAVASDGTVYAWGLNTSSQLATGSATPGYSSLPLAVPNFKLTPNSPDVTLSLSVGQSVSPGAATFTATPTDADGSGNLQKVEFYCLSAPAVGGESPVGTITSSPWSMNLPSLPAGNYYAYAVVTDLNGNQGMSTPVTFSIVPPDSDFDGLLDSWELTYFPNLGQVGEDDFDLDGLSNAWEFAHGTNPNTPPANRDSDGDGLPDDWEWFYFDILSQGPTNDQEDDRVNNAWEYAMDTNPVTATDADGDGLPDDWEMRWFGHFDQTGTYDPDGDGLTNLEEFTKRLQPTNPDTDGDGMSDGYESYYNLAPLSAASDPINRTGPNDDKDFDGRTNKAEQDSGLIPTSNTEQPYFTFSPITMRWFGVKDKIYVMRWTTDFVHWTTVPRAWVGSNQEIFVFQSDVWAGAPPSPFFFQLWIYGNGGIDADGDGLSDLFEAEIAGSDPDKADTDGDGISDSLEIGNIANPGGLQVFTPLQ